jgi:hypothetical protein
MNVVVDAVGSRTITAIAKRSFVQIPIKKFVHGHSHLYLVE